MNPTLHGGCRKITARLENSIPLFNSNNPMFKKQKELLSGKKIEEKKKGQILGNAIL